mmetsp:Transcript_68570/g.135583  ORF Transcript_68570/g.135583 Transcript_68570/m.135583 type:complete len:374 (+) Transcript_68570:3-1124(+)
MVTLRLPARLHARQQCGLALAVLAAAAWSCSVGRFGIAQDVPTPHRCKQRGSATAFAWPTRPMKKGRGPTKRSKKNLLDMLRDDDTLISKTHWVIGLMHKYKFWRTYWEYNIGLKKLVRVGAWFSALELWEHMQAKKVEADGATYSFAICACMAGGKWASALELFDEMELYNKRPRRLGAEQGLMACDKGGKWQRALAILDGMWERSQTPNEDTYMPAIRACENAGEHAIGDKLFWEMRRNTKLMKAEEQVQMPLPGREPPKAEPAPWRLPGAIAADAYDPPKKRLESGLPDENNQVEVYKPWVPPMPLTVPPMPQQLVDQNPRAAEYLRGSNAAASQTDSRSVGWRSSKRSGRPADEKPQSNKKWKRKKSKF